MRRFTCSVSSSRNSPIRDSRLCVISTKIERKIASSETMVVSIPYGYGSNCGRPNHGMFQRIQKTKMTACMTRNGAELAIPIMRSAQISICDRFAALLYTIGLVGTGLLAIPTLAGSAAYAFAETFGWRQGIDENLRGAKKFYLVLALAIIVGMAINVANVNAVKALYWSAVLNGLLAPFLLLGILLVASDKQLMGKQPSSPLGLVTVGLTTIVMFAAAVGMFIV